MSSPDHPLLVLDASALVELMQGHLDLMSLVDRAYYGEAILAVPSLAVLEAQAASRTIPRLWDHLLRLPGMHDLELSMRNAAFVGDLAGPRLEQNPLHTSLMGEQMAAQVAYEAI
jgi:hypothetical protein